MITKSLITKCAHNSRPHHAQGMCRECFYLFGHKIRETICKHPERAAYCKKLCHSCYTNSTKQIRMAISAKKKNIDFIQTQLPEFMQTELVVPLINREGKKLYAKRLNS